ncbi:2-oxoglutarate (2OG) and Fe(II)-dependent oxygenase superfamily protein [Thalictrum thalictroides]|uniref:procollagen-proline 3-dioxygenase n=1 Tax=Thalictrum thalictroides TaxID=46969 RepID=A0A7J6WJN7_THATH|nr:2-oxoglutarate (2OG) and Fe(II)-dependent oxygenase superfamily protein [Thalictrum thalictroides]
MGETGEGHPRLILHDFISLDLCKELEFIHKSCSAVGYRPNVFSTTLSHLIATNCGHLILPFVSIRERLKEKAEEFFGCEYELFVEFTGLISWTKGASIGWHSDDNRSYLKQRDFAAVCYLNSHGKDFKGGLFHFLDGEPATIVPMAGDVVMYTADSCNIHSVDEITDGERLTLTLWFSRDSSYDEDAKLISHLPQSLSNSLDDDPASYLPFPAPSNMYWFSSEQAPSHQSGFDISWARVHILGYSFCFSDDKICDFKLDSSCDLSEQLMKPLWLARDSELFSKEFVNSLHALQVVQFYCWKVSDLHAINVQAETTNVTQLLISHTGRSCRMKSMLLGDPELAKKVFHSGSTNEYTQISFDWADLYSAVVGWENYSRQLRKKLLASLPYWKTYQSIFPVSSQEIEGTA